MDWNIDLGCRDDLVTEKDELIGDLMRLLDMEPNRTNQTRNVRVRYLPGEYGLALSIFDELEESTDDNANQHESALVDGVDTVGEDADEDKGVLTVIKSGVTTLELRRREGSGPSMLIWDEAEVDWEAVQAS